MFLEAQFGAENVTPIAVPKTKAAVGSPSMIKEDEEPSEGAEEEERALEARQRKEIQRLHKIGIPVPGVEIKVNNAVAKVWLEDLEIEGASRVLCERVRTVVERAVEVTAPLWM